MSWEIIETTSETSRPLSKASPRNIRILTYRQALHEAQFLNMQNDDSVFIMGEGVDDPAGVFGTTTGFQARFGAHRVFDTPIAENSMTGIAAGAALTGMKPIIVHMRMDFLLLAMDQIVNHISKWSYMFAGKAHVPLVIRAIIGRGWGSAAQHSQSLQGLFMHIPGLKIAIPSTPYDVKGLLNESLKGKAPVLFIEHRWLYEHTGPVPQRQYCVPFGKGIIRKRGKDLTIAAVSYMVPEAMRAAAVLKESGIDAEIIDLRSLKPLDDTIILTSLKKTGRLIIADTGWLTGGVAAEIAARAAESAFTSLKAPIQRVCSPDCPTPACATLEKLFYPGAEEIVRAAKKIA